MYMCVCVYLPLSLSEKIQPFSIIATLQNPIFFDHFRTGNPSISIVFCVSTRG